MPTQNHLRRSWRCCLRLLTPLHMGAGQDAALSPYQDFVARKGRLYYLSRSKMEAALKENPACIDRMVRQMQAAMNNNRSEFDLGHFIVEELKRQPEELAAYSLPIEPEGAKMGRLNLQRFAHSAGRPFVPGSGVKGAIRTALTYAFLDPEGVAPEKSPLVGDMKKKALKAMQSERKASNDLRFTDPEAQVLGRMADDHLAYLRVSDSKPLATDRLVVGQLTRPSVFEEQGQALPFWAELLPTDTSLEFELALQDEPARKQQTKSRLDFLRQGHLQPLFDALNTFAAEACSRERAEMEDGFAMRGFNARPKIESLLKSIQDDAQSHPPNAAYLRLGWGKTYFENSIGLAMEDDFENEEKQASFWVFRKALGIGKHPKFGTYALDFPAMRTFTTQKGGSPLWPLGWAKLEIDSPS